LLYSVVLPIFIHDKAELLAVDVRAQDESQLLLDLFVRRFQDDLAKTFDLGPLVKVESLGQEVEDRGVFAKLFP
jgi:hypothetical protein